MKYSRKLKKVSNLGNAGEEIPCGVENGEVIENLDCALGFSDNLPTSSWPEALFSFHTATPRPLNHFIPSFYLKFIPLIYTFCLAMQRVGKSIVPNLTTKPRTSANTNQQVKKSFS